MVQCNSTACFCWAASAEGFVHCSCQPCPGNSTVQHQEKFLHEVGNCSESKGQDILDSVHMQSPGEKPSRWTSETPQSYWDSFKFLHHKPVEMGTGCHSGCKGGASCKLQCCAAPAMAAVCSILAQAGSMALPWLLQGEDLLQGAWLCLSYCRGSRGFCLQNRVQNFAAPDKTSPGQSTASSGGRCFALQRLSMP